jgi:hypothetical protein
MKVYVVIEYTYRGDDSERLVAIYSTLEEAEKHADSLKNSQYGSYIDTYRVQNKYDE